MANRSIHEKSPSPSAVILKGLILLILLLPGALQAETQGDLGVNLKKHLRKKGRVLIVPAHTRDQDLEQLSLPRFQKVKELILDNSKVTDKGLAAITHLALDKLYLTGTVVGDRGLEEVAKIPTITQLSLKGTAVTDAGVARVAHLPIEKIYLNDTAVTDQVFEHLSGLTLETLYIENTAVSDNGFHRLKGQPIRALNIARTRISSSSLPILMEFPLYKAFLKGSGLTAEDVRRLTGNKVSVDY
jgi:hypothetical protein